MIAAGLVNANPFRNVSARLLADLLERAGTTTLRVHQRVTVEAAFIVVVSGRLRVEDVVAVPDAAEGSGTVLEAGDVYWIDSRITANRLITLRAIDPTGAVFVRLTQKLLVDATLGSFTLARHFVALLGPGVVATRAHTIWMCTAPPFALHREALTQLLAASLARDGEHAAMVVFRSGVVALRLWSTDRFVNVPFTPPVSASDADVVAALDTQFNPLPPFYHLLFLNLTPSSLHDVPPPFTGQRFDRIVYVTKAVPRAIPDGLAGILKTTALNPTDPGDAYFSSFIPSVPVPVANPQGATNAPALSSLVPSLGQHAVWSLTGAERFASEPLHDEVNGPYPPRWRLNRDLCRLGLNLPALSALWSGGATLATPSFPTAAFAKDKALKETMERWARAVTNRRVGLALSGGGAASYRMVPLIQSLRDHNVPIDVVGALSGGSLLGAYYCRYGPPGLQQYIARGSLYQKVVYAAVLTSWLLEAVVDWDLGESAIDQLEVRFVPVTTALPGHGPPRPSAVVGGTLGEAVRASGAAPGLFARTKKLGTQYSDGISSSPVPARAVRDHGADLIFAFNAIPGPDRRNPLSRVPGGECLYQWTPLGRLIDVWVAGAFLLERTSQQASRDAHVSCAASPVDAPLLETFRFDQAATLAQRSGKDPHVRAGANQCIAKWSHFKAIP